MRRTLFCISLLICGCIALSAKMNYKRNVAILDSLRNTLSSAPTIADSLAICYDMFDVAPRSLRGPVGMELYEMAKLSGDASAKLDVLRRITSFYTSNDTIQRWCVAEIERIPETDEQKASAVFARTMLLSSQVNKLTEAQRKKEIYRLLQSSRVKDENMSEYERVEQLFALCIYLNATLQGDVLSDYLTRLGELIKQMPYHLDALSNIYYLQAALLYSDNNEPEKSIAAYRELLALMDRMEQRNVAEGRKYRNYDTNYYSIYRRMLRNASVLTDEEIDEYYNKVLNIARQNSDVRADLENNEMAIIYYLMAKKRYSEALPLLRRQVARAERNNTKIYLYKAMIEAGTAIDDKHAMFDGAVNYSRMLEDYFKERSYLSAREFKMLYAVNDLKLKNDELTHSRRETEQRFHRNALWVCGVLVFVLLLFAVLLLLSYRKARRLATNLSRSNESLVSERDNLQRIQRELLEARDRARKADRHKTEFINNMSHEITTPLETIVECSRLIVDTVSEEKRRYLEHYMKAMEVSADMLRVLVNDVLDIASMDNSQMVVECRPVSLAALCKVALTATGKYVKDGVKVRFANQGEPDETVNTDPKRVEQVLVNLLNNAAKFTDEGYIEIGYEADRHNRFVTFHVTDTGCGIPEGKDEEIFERFTKLSDISEGLGLGLNICRMVADLLGGEVKLDRSYDGPGSRFVFTIPNMV